MNEYKPYTYLIGWSALNIWYYGVEYGNRKKIANPNNLWNTYFTSSKYVKNFIKLHGEPDVIKIRMIFKTKEMAKRCETKVLEKINATYSPNWLNKSNGSTKFHSPEFFSDEVKQKISNQLKGRIFTEEHRKNLSKALKGKQNSLGSKRSKESCKKMSEARKGHIVSEQTREKSSKFMKEYFKTNPNPFSGKKHTDETKQKISLANKGKPSPNKGKSPSEESRQKMSESAKKRHKQNFSNPSPS